MSMCEPSALSDIVYDEEWPETEDSGDWDDDWETKDNYDEIEETVPKLLEDPYVAEIHDTFLRLLAEEKKAQLEKDYQLAFELELKEGEEIVKSANEAVKSAKKAIKSSKKVQFYEKVIHNPIHNRKPKKTSEKHFVHKSTQTDQ